MVARKQVLYFCLLKKCSDNRDAAIDAGTWESTCSQGLYWGRATKTSVASSEEKAAARWQPSVRWLRAGHALGFRIYFFKLPVYRLTAFPQRLNFFVMPFLRRYWHWVRINKLPLSKYLYLNMLLPCPAARNPPVNAVLQKTGHRQRPLSCCAEQVFGGLIFIFPAVSKRRLSRTEDLAPVSHTAQATSNLQNFPKNLACPACPQPRNLWVVEWEGGSWFSLLFLHLIIVQQPPNKTFFDQT